MGKWGYEMPFWQLQTHADRPALIQGDTVTRYRQLADLADAWQNDVLPAHASFGLLQMPNHVQAIACYLACLRSGKHAPLLLSASTSAEQIAQLAAHYQPDWLLLTDDTPAPAGYSLHHHCEGLSFYRLPTATPKPQHPALALLLSTSGSTGSSKLVRLSASALDSNAQAILEYLGLHAEDRAITTLPLAYSFGMSILNSHLAVGGAVVLTDASMMDRNFWEAARTHSITSLSGVPATYEMLHRLGLHRLGLDKLRMLTQAGGRLRDDLIRAFAQTCRRMDIQFHVMYGQTEAAPRISHVPPERLADKIGSIGIAIPGGEMAIDPDNTELIYRGPNVMLGYAETRADLALGDCQQGELRTGDLARQDDDGYFYRGLGSKHVPTTC
ncbi:phosphatase [Lysobacteraceae bacterium NML71-0210]|nr:phosphatase [Xanthomonadaceae bacterium NML71-0210]